MKKESKLDIRYSLLYQSFKVAVVLAIFVVGIFFCIPHTSYFTANVLLDEVEFEQGNVEELDMDFELMYINLSSPFTIYDGGTYRITITEDENYDGENYAVEASEVRIVPLDNNSYMYLGSRYNNDAVNLTKERTNYKEKKELHDGAFYTKTGILSDDNEKEIKTVFGDNMVIKNHMGIDITLYKCKIILTRYLNNDQQEFEGKTIDIALPLDGSCALLDKSMIGVAEYSYAHLNRLKISNLSEYNLLGEGELSVYYNPENDKYPIENQELRLHSNGKNIGATVCMSDTDKYEVRFSGNADQIKLSNNELLPDIMSLLKRNAYLSPTLLVTIIIGAISLIKIHADSEKSEKEKQLPASSLSNESSQVGLLQELPSEEVLKETNSLETEKKKKKKKH